ncbi:MAG: Gfo/Idh/MocA family oxidoreductase [Clostridia bacterium]|nr:Gfo/Idh/MocA family oxidoreductase [Clostridia bacterium]
MDKLRIGFVGYGRRGPGVLRTFAKMPDVEIVAVCDPKEGRPEKAAAETQNVAGYTPLCFSDYRKMIKEVKLDAVINVASWESHINVCIDCMEAGIPVGFEVGGAYNIEDCWDLVRAYERTGTPCMMLTNSKFDKRNMAISKMAREGLFGKIVHCDGAYCHYMTEGVIDGHYNLDYYRLMNYKLRNSENYPFHPMGTIAEILDITRGNKILTVSSVSSGAFSINEHIRETRGLDHPLAFEHFAQGDVITTTMKCVRGETITLRLDTTLPRVYSRRFEVHGTKGIFMEDGNLIYLKGQEERPAPELYNSAKEYVDKYAHPCWEGKEISIGNISLAMDTGHGGTDFLVTRAFLDSLKNGWPMITDVYDAATMMAVTPASEESIAKGGAPVMLPDFTRGAYIKRKPLTQDDNFWSAN